MQRHYLTLIEFEDFIRPAFKLCCEIMNLNSYNYRVEYEFSDIKRFGLFTFPNKITFYTNTLVYIGDDINANKTFIIHTIFHELVHSLQDVTQLTIDEMEFAADMIAVDYIMKNQNLIEKDLRFRIDLNVLDLYIKMGQDYSYIKASDKYIYSNLLKMITPKRYNINYDEFLDKYQDLEIIFLIRKGVSINVFKIKENNNFIDPTILINYLSNNILEYNTMVCHIDMPEEGVIFFDILKYSITPISV